MNKFQFLESKTHQDGSNSVFYFEDGNYVLERFSPKGKLLLSASTPYFDDTARYLTPIEEEQLPRTLGRKLTDLAPIGILIGGLSAWTYLANGENAKAGILAFGFAALCGIGFREMSKELSDKVNDFNNQLISEGFSPLYLKK